MQSSRGVYTILFLFIGANTLLANILTSQEQLWASGLLLSTSVFLCVVRPLFGFSLIVAEVLGLGFFATGKAFFEGWPEQVQAMGIIKLSAFMVAMGITWLTVLQIKRLWQRVRSDAVQLAQLKKYEDHNNVLTLNEFLYRAEALFVAMRRRGETGFWVKIKINPKGKDFALKTMNEHLSQAALQSVRNQYDLVGKTSDMELVLLLQNTNREGAAIVLGRLQRKIAETIQIPADMYAVEVSQLPAVWDEARMKIAGTTLPTRQERKRGIMVYST